MDVLDAKELNAVSLLKRRSPELSFFLTINNHCYGEDTNSLLYKDNNLSSFKEFCILIHIVILLKIFKNTFSTYQFKTIVSNQASY